MSRTIHLGCWVEYRGKAWTVHATYDASPTRDPTTVDIFRMPGGWDTREYENVNTCDVRLLIPHSDLAALATSVMESSHA